MPKKDELMRKISELPEEYLDLVNDYLDSLLSQKTARKAEDLKPNNEAALALIRSWIERDETKQPTPEQIEADRELMKVIDEHRERKLFEGLY